MIFPDLIKQYKTDLSGEVDSNGIPIDTSDFRNVKYGVTSLFQFKGIVYVPFNYGVTTKTSYNYSNLKGVLGTRIVSIYNFCLDEIKNSNNPTDFLNYVDSLFI